LTRVLPEIEYKLFKQKRDVVLTLAFLILYALVFTIYFVNEPTLVLGVSIPFLYSLIIWIGIIVVTIIAAVTVWR